MLYTPSFAIGVCFTVALCQSSIFQSYMQRHKCALSVIHMMAYTVNRLLFTVF